jgi:TolB-like protein/class 3 adenylate cyclase
MARRLAAIMFTDIAGYTALSQGDEPAALRLLQDQERLVRGLLEVHQGRLVKSMGDGLLLEFPSSLDAVACAVDLQRHIQERNLREPGPPLRVRIGIHLGDVEGAGSDILGDAVNVASRIEPLAEPGGICLSAQVYDQVHNKTPYSLERLGPKSLKGVQDPLEIYRLVPSWAVEVAPAETLPKLAVLPFANISPDAKDEYFADGLTEELITVLAQLPELRVIARTSVMPYKTEPKPVTQVGKELGASTVLEGSVRKAGDRLRITVQLIDVASQEHTWAETYDRKLEDIFAVQAEVAKTVATVLKLRLRKADKVRLERPTEVRPDSYLAYLRGRYFLMRSISQPSLKEAERAFTQAIELDDTNARAYSGLADVKNLLGTFFQQERLAELNEAGRKLALRALELDPHLAEAHTSLSAILYNAAYEPDWVGAENEARIAISLNPSYSQARWLYANILEEEARPDEALHQLRLARDADPQSRVIVFALFVLLYRLHRLDEMKIELESIRRLDSGWGYHSALAAFHTVRSDFDSAIQEALQAEDFPDDEGRTGPSINRAFIYALAGDKTRAKELLDELVRRPESWQLLGGMAEVYAVLGDLDECFRLLTKAWDKYHALALHNLRLNPSFEAVRNDPRFGTLLGKYGLKV